MISPRFVRRRILAIYREAGFKGAERDAEGPNGERMNHRDAKTQRTAKRKRVNDALPFLFFLCVFVSLWLNPFSKKAAATGPG